MFGLSAQFNSTIGKNDTESVGLIVLHQSSSNLEITREVISLPCLLSIEYNTRPRWFRILKERIINV